MTVFQFGLEIIIFQFLIFQIDNKILLTLSQITYKFSQQQIASQ